MLLFPMFARVREGGRSVSCASNLRQLGMAFIQYSQDNGGKLPAGKDNIMPPRRHGNGWGGPLFPYFKSAPLLSCPSNAGLNGVKGTASYAYNNSLVINFNSRKPSLKVGLLRAPAKTVLLCEVSTSSVFDIQDPNETTSPGANGLSSSPYITDGEYVTGFLGGYKPSGGNGFAGEEGLHNGVSNFLFCDGHVKALKGETVSPGRPAITSTADQVVGRSPNTAAGIQNPTYAGTFSPF